MLSEGRREGLKLNLNRSLSEPGEPMMGSRLAIDNLMIPGGGGGRPTSTSMPASPMTDSSGVITRSLLLRKSRVIEPADLARRLTRGGPTKSRTFLVLDLRPFVTYNIRHIRGAINVNCSDRFNRKRLQLRRATVVELASPAGRELLKKRCHKEVIVYDDASSDLESLSPQNSAFLVLSSLLEDNRDPILLRGGFNSFEKAYPELCEDALMRSKSELEGQEPCSPLGLCTEVSMGGIPPSPGNESVIEQAPIAQVLPFIYLGNARNAQDLPRLQALGINRVLNVTAHLPGFHEASGLLYKTLKAMDSGQQNLRQFFDEAISFIDDARRSESNVLVHCQAGVSRSATIVIAYLMWHMRMTMVDAYKWVKARRPIISPNLNFMGQLVEFEAALRASASMEPECKPCHQCKWATDPDATKVPSACQV